MVKMTDGLCTVCHLGPCAQAAVVLVHWQIPIIGPQAIQLRIRFDHQKPAVDKRIMEPNKTKTFNSYHIPMVNVVYVSLLRNLTGSFFFFIFGRSN
jgi:hypothetical protein